MPIAGPPPSAPAPGATDTAASRRADWQIVEQTPAEPPSWQAGTGATSAPTTTLPTTPGPAGYDPYGGYADPTRAQPAYLPHAPGGAPSYDYDPFEVTGSRFTPLMGLLVLLAGAVIASLFFNVIKVRLDEQMQTKTVRGLAGPLLSVTDPPATLVIAIAAVVVVAVVAAIILGAGYRRLGTGIGGGIGIAAAAWAASLLGVAVWLMDGWDQDARQHAARFTKTWDVGFFILAAIVVLGLVVFVISLPGSSVDGLRRFNPLLSVLGVVGALALAAGPLIPVNGASFGDNFPGEGMPVATIVARIASLLLIGFGAVVGFVNGRRWGLGLAAGSVAVAIVLWVASLLNDTQPGVGSLLSKPHENSAPLSAVVSRTNPGAIRTTPHLVTTLGAIGVLVALLGIGLLEQTRRMAARTDRYEDAEYEAAGYADEYDRA